MRFATRLPARTLCWLLAGLPAVGAFPHGSNDLSTEIPAQPLPQALIAFANSANLHLVYVSQLALGKISREVPAGLPAPDGLSRMLEGTGLTYEFLGPRTIKILERPKLKQPARDDPEVSLNEIVVSAMKRDELLSTVPMSISVLSADRLSESGITDISGVAAVSTGVEYNFSSQFGPGILTDIAIRGISAQKGGATTGLYIDDTPIQMPHSVFNNPFPLTFDLARVEVLRGPQGVLFGRSAEGGALRFITNEPSTNTTSELYHSEVSATEHGAPNYEAGAAAGGPLIADVLGARISAWYRHSASELLRLDVAEFDAGHVRHHRAFKSRNFDRRKRRHPRDLDFRVRPMVVYVAMERGSRDASRLDADRRMVAERGLRESRRGTAVRNEQRPRNASADAPV